MIELKLVNILVFLAGWLLVSIAFGYWKNSEDAAFFFFFAGFAVLAVILKST